MSTVEPIRNIPDIRRIEDALSKNKRDLLLFTIGINCGLRVSDILALNVGDVKGKNFIKLTEKKTGKAKKIPINKKLLPMFAEFTRGKASDNPLFMTKFKNRLNRVTAYKYNKTSPRKKVDYTIHLGHTLCEKLLAITIIVNSKILQCCKKYLITPVHK